MDIDKMEAGPELDRLVGERAMGCRVVKYRGRTRDLYRLKVPGSYDRVDFITADGAWHAVPKYSTDISAAWEVVEKMRYPHLLDDGPELSAHRWECIVFPNGNDAMAAYAPTAPLAICRAALKAKDVTQESGASGGTEPPAIPADTG